jgi:hypothetical protein
MGVTWVATACHVILHSPENLCHMANSQLVECQCVSIPEYILLTDGADSMPEHV